MPLKPHKEEEKKPLTVADLKPYRTVFIDPDYRVKPKGNWFCCRCGKTIKGNWRGVHLVDGGMNALHPADETLYVSDGGEMGMHPIGPDCAKIIGLDYTHPQSMLPRPTLLPKGYTLVVE
jgi:hypothetical protein